MLISVHIPKTGGTSFKELLAANYGRSLLLDYADKPMQSSDFARIKAAIRYRNKPKIDNFENIKCIHGHFLPIKYSGEKQNVFLVWLRDPVERVVSRYYHLQRHFQRTGNYNENYIKNPNLSLIEFVQIEQYQNTFAKYLFGMDLSDFTFVGITEKYAQSIELFNSLFAENLVFDNTQLNSNETKQYAYYEICDETRNAIIQNNAADVELYAEALERFNADSQRLVAPTLQHASIR